MTESQNETETETETATEPEPEPETGVEAAAGKGKKRGVRAGIEQGEENGAKVKTGMQVEVGTGAENQGEVAEVESGGGIAAAPSLIAAGQVPEARTVAGRGRHAAAASPTAEALHQKEEGITQGARVDRDVGDASKVVAVLLLAALAGARGGRRQHKQGERQALRQMKAAGSRPNQAPRMQQAALQQALRSVRGVFLPQGGPAAR